MSYCDLLVGSPFSTCPNSSTRSKNTNVMSTSTHTTKKDLEVDGIDERDKGTPDDWIPRNKELIRVTGRHPFNAEPPAKPLLQSFITPNRLHFVRTHGSVPKLDWNTHKVIVEGANGEQLEEFSMDDIVKMPSIEIAVTVTCDGNRRKEINMIRSTRGPPWGCCVTGTAMWKGARLCDILTNCGVKPNSSSHPQYIILEGSDHLNHGVYETSIPLNVAINPQNDVILAYEMNGEKLPPDHGYPIRVIVPGFVGGRMVKWLKKITISEKDTQNYYHLHDNRGLPSQITWEIAESGRWWEKPEYLLLEHSINSAIVYPSHEEYICLNDVATKYTVRGFAYSGGGRRIQRVEVSLDSGKKWCLCKLEFPSDHVRYGSKSWVWCHWSIEIPVWRLFRSSSIVVKAWDSAFNTQPAEPVWNVLGMMNNSWYKVQINLVDQSIEPLIIFKHPVQPGDIGGGWMVAPRREPMLTLATPWGVTVERSVGRLIPRSEVAKHNSEKDCWVVIDGRVYDLSYYLREHPGGANSIVCNGGRDASRDFHCIHARDADNQKEMFCIGMMIEDNPPLFVEAERGLNSKKWIEIKLVEKLDVTWDTRLFRFKIPEKAKVGLPVGQHLLLGAEIGGQFIVRPYTPVFPTSKEEDHGTIDLVVKIYFANYNPAFPQGGIFTQYLDTLKIGDSLLCKGPTGHVNYLGNGIFTFGADTFKVEKISMIAGGTGITPIIQLAKAVLQNPNDDLKVNVLFANHTEDDILMKDSLDELANLHHKNFKVWYTVSQPPRKRENWKFSVGRVNERMIKDHLFSPDPVSAVLLCGPPGLIEQACYPNLQSLGYAEATIYEF